MLIMITSEDIIDKLVLQKSNCRKYHFINIDFYSLGMSAWFFVIEDIN